MKKADTSVAMTSSEPRLPDERNRDILVFIDGDLCARDEARISVFDSVVQGGDAVWEGLRVYGGRIAELEGHLDRLFNSAHALDFRGIPDRSYVRRAIRTTLEANGMDDEAHIRLTLTRGRKVTSGMDPRNNQYGCTLIVLAEWKKPVYPEEGIRLVTASIRRNTPQILDSKIHHNNILNNILAKIEANVAGADGAVMLDLHGFVAETNATNIFIAVGGCLITPRPDACLPGITRGLVIRLASEDGIEVIERNVSLSEVYIADEVLTTGTMGGLTAVQEVDGRRIVNKAGSDITGRLKMLHSRWVRAKGVAIGSLA